MFFIIVLSFLLFYIWMRIGNTKSAQLLQKKREEFWSREYHANAVRKVELSSLDYIKIPIENLPINDTEDQQLLSYQNTIINLSDKSILNLTGISNTDLKLEYGTSNITFLSECDNNYTLLVSTLYKWGSYLFNNDNVADAITILEFGIYCNTDVYKNYTLLAYIYKNMKKPDKIYELIHVAEALNSRTKGLILKELNNILS